MWSKLEKSGRRKAAAELLIQLLESEAKDKAEYLKSFTNKANKSSHVVTSEKFGTIHITTTESTDINSSLPFDDDNGSKSVFSDKDYICFIYQSKDKTTLFFFVKPEKLVGKKGIKKSELNSICSFSGLNKNGLFRISNKKPS